MGPDLTLKKHLIKANILRWNRMGEIDVEKACVTTLRDCDHSCRVSGVYADTDVVVGLNKHALPVR